MAMSDQANAEQQACAPVKVSNPFLEARRNTAVRRAIAAFVPSGSHAEICALFHNRASITTIRHWRLGRRAMPQWAWDILKARAAPIDEIPIGVGRAVSKYNLPSIRAQKEKAGV